LVQSCQTEILLLTSHALPYLNPKDYDKGASGIMPNVRKIKIKMLKKQMHQGKEAEEDGRKERRISRI
jgi:hypothetical protein